MERELSFAQPLSCGIHSLITSDLVILYLYSKAYLIIKSLAFQTSIPGLVIAIELVQDFMIREIRLRNLCYLMGLFYRLCVHCFMFCSFSINHDIFINYLTIPLFINTFFVNIYFYSYVHNFII